MLQAIIRLFCEVEPAPGVRVLVEILDQNPEIPCPWCKGVELHESKCSLMEGVA